LSRLIEDKLKIKIEDSAETKLKETEAPIQLELTARDEEEIRAAITSKR